MSNNKLRSKKHKKHNVITFPWRHYNYHTLVYEFKKLENILKNKKLSTKDFNNSSNVGKLVSNNFFQHERMKSSRFGHTDGLVFWNENKKFIKEYKKQYPYKDYFSLIQFLNKIPCQFPPLIAGYIYSLFGAKSVFDPFAGWGDRCLAAIALEIKYIGCDTNIHLKKCYNKMLKFINYSSDVTIVYKDCITQVDNIENVDIVFSSPPFFSDNGKSLEIYKHDKCVDDYAKFITQCLIPLFEKMLSKCDWICLHIPKHTYNLLKEIFGKADKSIHFGTKNNYGSNNGSKINNIIYCWKCSDILTYFL